MKRLRAYYSSLIINVIKIAFLKMHIHDLSICNIIFINVRFRNVEKLTFNCEFSGGLVKYL